MTRVLAFALLLVHAAAPGAPLYMVDTQATAKVYNYIQRNDCPGAVRAINEAIKEGKPDILLMAATMYEDGVCLKQNWEQATLYYQRAHEAGHPSGLSRMIGVFAKDNRDPGAALWWSAQAHPRLPGPCQAADHLQKDPEAFVAALNKWPHGQLAACVYTAGVYHRVVGQVEFPPDAQGVYGKVTMVFNPSKASIVWNTDDIDRISISREVQAGDEQGTVFRHSFLKYLNGISQRTIKEFPAQAGVDPSWSMSTHFTFGYQ